MYIYIYIYLPGTYTVKAAPAASDQHLLETQSDVDLVVW